MKTSDFKNKEKGYTIIETMISVSLFLIVITTGIGSLLNANLVHNKSRNVRSVMDNLSFIMEDMSRNLRTGYNYRCYDFNHPWDGAEAATSSIENPRSCASGYVIAFEEAINGVAGGPLGPEDQWVYRIGSVNGGPIIISKSIDGGQNFIPLHGSELLVNGSSGFSILGAEAPTAPGAGDKQQPLVFIKLAGKILYKDLESPFSLQTMVTQRLIDIVNP